MNKAMLHTKHTIHTKLGKFTFGWVNDWIYGRFDEPAKAKKIYDCNPFTGKYNFHYDPLAELMDFLYDMKNNNLLIK